MNDTRLQINDNEILLDQIRSLLHRESLYIKSSIGAKSRRPPLQHIRYRHKIFEWFYKTVGHFQYDREVVPISMDYVDRFLLLHPGADDISSRTYQLVAVASLYLAVKIHIRSDSHSCSQADIPSRRHASLQEYADLSSGQFSPRDILSMELCVLGTLEWKMNPVSPICFTHHFLKLVGPINKDEAIDNPSDYSIEMDLNMEVLHELSLHFTERAISLPEITPYYYLDSCGIDSVDCFTFSPSTVAFASILLGIEAISSTALSSHIREQFLQRCLKLTSQSGLILHPNRKDIQELKVMIKNSFRPDAFLNQATTRNEQDFYKDKSIYPIP